MNEFMSKSFGSQKKKYLLRSVLDDNNNNNELNVFKIREFRVCDCYLDWILSFQKENKNTVFSEELMTDFFDEIPTDIECDVFSIFGKVTIVCCRRALYHFFCKEDVQHEKLSDDFWVMTSNAVVCIYSKRNCSFHIFVQIVNLIL